LKITSTTRRYRNGFERLYGNAKDYFKLRGCVYTTYPWRNYRIEIYTNSVILNDSEESEEQNKTNIAIRVIVDHVCVAFAIA
jgi:hypothetical protein